jgi:VIT1/CCC1 family predicted Fe2+/Mn2+ transporter
VIRESVHVEPSGIVAIARHYIRDLVYGANDGIITTFAVVAGVAGGSLSTLAVLIVGASNLAADGVAMGVGNLLAIRSHESALAAAGRPEEEAYPWKHGLATLVAFVVAGIVPLVPYMLTVPDDVRLPTSLCSQWHRSSASARRGPPSHWIGGVRRASRCWRLAG